MTRVWQRSWNNSRFSGKRWESVEDLLDKELRGGVIAPKPELRALWSGAVCPMPPAEPVGLCGEDDDLCT